MLRNYVTIAIRNFRKHLLFSLLNVFGLALGLAASILILLWVQEEINYDTFNKNYEQIHRVTIDATDMQFAVSPAPLASAMKATLSGIENTTRLNETSNILESGDKKFEEKNGFFAEPSFFEIFSYPLLKGDAKTALRSPKEILITEKTALKYFNTTEAVGKSFKVDNQETFVVTGVLKNIPSASHLQFDYLLPLSYLEKLKDPLRFKSWRNVGVYTYIKLKPGTDLPLLQKQINKLYKKNESELKLNFNLQPLSEIHLHSNLSNDLNGHGNIQYVRIFALAALFIWLMACINFINLSTARSAGRAKEVGLRKVIGADRKQLILQFLGESLLTSFLAVLLALLIAAYFLPSFNQLCGKKLDLNFCDRQFVSGIILLVLFTGFLAGLYPALFLSSFKPIAILKKTLTIVTPKTGLRSVLVVLQFVITMILISGTIIIYQQIQFIKNRNLGFEKENLIYIPLKGDLNHRAFKDALIQNPLTSNFTETHDLPSNLNSSSPVSWPGSDPQKQVLFYNLGVDQNFIKTFKISLISGQNFLSGKRGKKAFCVINEKAALVMALSPDAAIGKPLIRGGDTAFIIGVVKDFNFKPLHTAIEPIVLNQADWGNFIVVKAKPNEIKTTITALSQMWEKAESSAPFEYNFLDQDLNKLYQTENRITVLSKAFAVLAILISCLGLYGLVVFTAEQRVKEIVIRKVLGATVVHITTLMSASFLRLILIALVIGLPVSVYLMNKWLQSFAYHIEIKAWMFAAAGVISISIGIVTISFRCLKAAIANPVKKLRSE